MVVIQRLSSVDISNIDLSGSLVFNITTNQLNYNDGSENVLIIDNKIITDHIINFLSGVVLGNAQQNKVLTLDGNKDITGINSLDLIQPLDNGSGGTGINTYNKGDILVASDNNILTKLNIPINNGEFLTTDTSTNTGISWNSYLLKKYLRFSDPEYLTSTTYFIEYLYTKLSNNLFIENKTLDLDTIGINGLLSSSTLSGTVLIDSISTTVTGTNTTFTTDFVVGDVINILNNYRRITNITSNTQLTIDSVYTLLNTFWYCFSINNSKEIRTKSIKCSKCDFICNFKYWYI